MKRSIDVLWIALCCAVILASLSCASAKKQADPIADLRAGIEKQVADPARAMQMSVSVDLLERLAGELGALVGQQQHALTLMLRDYTTSREAFEASLAEFNDRRTSLARQMLDAHIALKSAATVDEWKKLRKLEENALQYAIANSLGEKSLFEKEK